MVYLTDQQSSSIIINIIVTAVSLQAFSDLDFSKSPVSPAMEKM